MATAEAEFIQGGDATFDSKRVKFKEFSLLGSVLDASLDTLKYRLRSLCDNVDPIVFHEHEVSYILGDKGQLLLPSSAQVVPPKQAKMDHPASSPLMPAPSPAGSIHSVATPQNPMTPQTPGGMQQSTPLDQLKPVVISTTRSIEEKNKSAAMQVKYFGNLEARDAKVVSNCRPCVISSVSDTISKLLIDAWSFKQDYEIVTKGWQYTRMLQKPHWEHKNQIKTFHIKIRLYKVYKVTVPGLVTDKMEPQTTSHFVEATLIDTASGKKEAGHQTSRVLSDFAKELLPLCVLDR